MKALVTEQFVCHMLTCGSFSTLELMWISDTNVQKQKAKTREVVQQLLIKGVIQKRFSNELQKNVYQATTPLNAFNPRCSDRNIIFKAQSRDELIDFISNVYQQFGFLPDKVLEKEAYYYQG